MTHTGIDIDRTGVGGRARIRARVGILGIGLEAYWSQFEGLRERIEGYQRRVEERRTAGTRTVVHRCTRCGVRTACSKT